MYEIYEKILKERGLSSYQVSKATGISQQTLSYWKSGRSIPKTDKLKRIADFLGVSLEYLTTGYDNIEPEYSSLHFRSVEDAVKFILEQPMVAQFRGYDLDKMTDEEIIEFANDVAGMIELLGKKYNK